MFTSRRVVRATALALGLVVVGACSGEDLLENAIENRIEAESGEDVDIDFDDGNFTIESEDGTVEFSTDDDGNVTVDGVGEAGEEFSINSDDGTTTIESEDGTVEFSTDDDGNVSVDGVGEEGEEFSINSDEGTTTFETDDGTAVVTQGGDIPDCLPPEIVLPDSLEVVMSQVVDTPEESNCMLVAQAPGDFGDYTEAVAASLEAAGYTQEQSTTSPTGALLAYTNSEHSVFAQIAPQTGTDGISLTIAVGPAS